MSFSGTYKLEIGVSNSKKKKSFKRSLVVMFIYVHFYHSYGDIIERKISTRYTHMENVNACKEKTRDVHKPLKG